MATATAKEKTKTTEAADVSILDNIIKNGNMTKDVSQEAYAKDLVGEFASQVLDEGMVIGDDLDKMIKERIAELDKLINDQLNEVIHAKDFLALEGSWRGLAYLTNNTPTSTSLQIKVLNAQKQELNNDLQRAVEFDQSVLFKQIYESEYGTFGGNPFSLLIGDFEFGRSAVDIGFLEKISSVAAAAHAPFISSASPLLFDFESFTELDRPRDLAKLFESAELAKWRSFRESDDSRYSVLTLPRVLMRLPYGPDTLPAENLNFVEEVEDDHENYCWGSSAYSLGVRITNAFANHKWCAAIRGVEGGGLVEGLPTYTYKSEDGEVVLKCPTELPITDRREKELNELGFLSLLHCKGTDQAAFFGAQTVNKPGNYISDLANANAKLSSMLPYILAASRFAHYIKVIMRDKIGSFASKDEISTFLNSWIKNYILSDDSAGQEVKAKFPLREARVDVSDVAGKPGTYNAVVFIRPHFQLEELTASIRLVAELPESAG